MVLRSANDWFRLLTPATHTTLVSRQYGFVELCCIQSSVH